MFTIVYSRLTKLIAERGHQDTPRYFVVEKTLFDTAPKVIRRTELGHELAEFWGRMGQVMLQVAIVLFLHLYIGSAEAMLIQGAMNVRFSCVLAAVAAMAVAPAGVTTTAATMSGGGPTPTPRHPTHAKCCSRTHTRTHTLHTLCCVRAQVSESLSHTLVAKHVLGCKYDNAWGATDEKPEGAVEVFESEAAAQAAEAAAAAAAAGAAAAALAATVAVASAAAPPAQSWLHRPTDPPRRPPWRRLLLRRGLCC